MEARDISIYIHYPFCKKKCPYCDFNSHVATTNPKTKEWLKAYAKEIDFYFTNILKQGVKYNIKTIFFGGGTPSLMEESLVGGIINHLAKQASIDANCEITLEANPSSFEAQKFAGFKEAGINRVSIGVQALNDADLQTLGRLHDAQTAIKAVYLASSIFDNYSIDLIYARHGQKLQDWESELNFALSNLVKNHISLYTLTIEKGTEYYSLARAGKIIVPEGDASYDFYNLTDELTGAAGFGKYEVSNYAKTGFECRHNIAYWTMQDWIGIGAGAFSRYTIDGCRFAANSFHEPQKWLDASSLSGNALQVNYKLEGFDIAHEALMMGLRTSAGVNLNFVRQKFNLNILDFVIKQKLQQLLDAGMLELNDNNNNLKASKAGVCVLNSVINSLI